MNSPIDKWKDNPDKLCEILVDGMYKERSLAAHYLGILKDKNTTELLKNQLSDSVPVVVKSVADALLKIGVDQETEKLINDRLTELVTYENRLEQSITEKWKPLNEEEERKQLERYASESHIRMARKKKLKHNEGINKNWLIASTIIGLLLLLYYMADFLFS